MLLLLELVILLKVVCPMNDDDLWSANESCMEPGTPIDRTIDDYSQDEFDEDILFFPINFDKNLFSLNETKDGQYTAHTFYESPESIGMHLDYALEYDLYDSEYITSCSSKEEIINSSSTNSKQRSFTALFPVQTGSPRLNSMEEVFLITVNSITKKVKEYELTPCRVASGQGYHIKRARDHHHLATFCPISQERGVSLNPDGLRNFFSSENIYPNGEYYLRETVAYALDEASGGVFHVPITLTARFTGVGEGFLQEHIHPTRSLTDARTLYVNEVNQFRLLFDIFFYNGNCQEGIYGEGFLSTSSPLNDRSSEEANRLVEWAETEFAKPKMYYPDNAYILPDLDTPTSQLIFSFSKHYSKSGMMEQWSPKVLDFVNSISDPRLKYSAVLEEFGFPKSTMENVAMAILTVQKSIKRLTPRELLDFMFFQKHPFIFTAFSIANRSQETGTIAQETWSNLSIVIDMALDTYYEGVLLTRRANEIPTVGLHMLGLTIINYHDVQIEQDEKELRDARTKH